MMKENDTTDSLALLHQTDGPKTKAEWQYNQTVV